jgi:hypothetical protein
MSKQYQGVASSNAKELKYRDASTISLGILCTMSNSDSHAHKKVSEDELVIIHAKDGSLMQSTLREV